MGQIVSAAAKPKRCNLQSLSSLGTPAAGEYILVSSDNSMNAAGQGDFDCYIVGDGQKAATALKLKSVVDFSQIEQKIGKVTIPVSESGKAIYLNGGVGSTIGAPVTSSYSYSRYPVTPGNIVIVNGNGGGGPRLWGFVDANGVILSAAEASVAEKDLWLTVPANSAEVIINTNDLSVPCYYYNKESVEYKLDEFEGRVEGIPLQMRYNKAINLSGGVGTIVPSPISAAGWGYFDHPCDEGSRLLLSGTGGTYGLWSFVDAENKILSWSGGSARGDNLTVVAPENAVRVVGNIYNPVNYPAPVVFNADSVQVKLDETNDRIDDISDELSLAFTRKTITPTFTTGKYISKSGNIATHASWEYGTFAVEKGDIILVHFEGSTGTNVAVVALPTLNTTEFVPKVISANGITDYTYICEEDGTIVVSGITETLSISVIHSRIDEQLKDAGFLYGIKRIYPEFTFTDRQYWTKSGTKANLAGYQRSSGVFLKKGTYISIYWPGVTNDYISILTEVDSEDGFIRACVTTPSPNVEGEIKYVIDKDGFYALSNNSACVERYVIVEFANGDLFFNPPLDSLFLQVQEQDEMPREILRTSSFAGIVHKWGFIGDSLSSGEQAVHEDGTSTLVRFDKYDYSWGQRLCALNGVEGYNFSAGGQTTKGWCTGSGDRTWAGAQLQENWKEAYCIALGVNDRSSLSSGDADTDINLSDYTQNADTFAGWYAGIIQRLRSVNPKCRIFCLTIPYNNQQGYLDNNEVIRAIVPKFSKCYLVDLANYHWTPSGLALNDHLSPAGYQWAAWEINTLLDWIIRKNLSDFEDIAFVGTNYSK